MQKVFAILSSILILLQSFNINVEDISKLNVLFEHAKFHQETYGDSFLEFILEHYGTCGDEISTDHKEHDDLPFKHNHQTYSQSNSVFVLSTFIYQFQNTDFYKIPFNFFYKDSHSFFEKSSVFQPPKTA